MSNQGTKRATPGADSQKNPLGDVELTDEDAVQLQAVQKDIARVELALERRAQEKMATVYEKRRAVVKNINRFWAVALMNHPMLQIHASHASDQAALSYLEDVWIVRDPVESRCFTLEFYFKENPYFSNTVLKKEYKYIPPPVDTQDKPDEDGITETMLEFSWERDSSPQSVKINWKDESKNLTKQHPRVKGDDSDDEPMESGSFFNFFEYADDPYNLGILIANDIFPEVIDYFLGNVNDDDDSDDEEDSEDEDEEEIDLEKPRPKKPKKA